jgi:hypothetical protein
MVAFDSDVPGLVHDQEVFVELKYLLSVTFRGASGQRP